MTIRRHVDLAAINSDYTAFTEAVDRALASADYCDHKPAVRIMELIGNTVDEVLRDARSDGLQACNCDGIREIEILLFDMLRSKNPTIVSGVLFAYPDLDAVVDGIANTAMQSIGASSDSEDPATANPWIGNDQYLRSGEGDMWHVRVTASNDELNYCDFEVRAKDVEEAATKAETVARRDPEYYFETNIIPTYHADRHDIELLEDPELPDDSEEQYSGSDAPFPGTEA